MKAIVFSYTGQDRLGYTHTPYRVLAHNVDELLEAMKGWHSYGGRDHDTITPNGQFINTINELFENGVVYDVFKHEIHSAKTRGCGCWSITWMDALADTLEGHIAIENEKIQAAAEERKRKSEEIHNQLMIEFNKQNRGWYTVTCDVYVFNRDQTRIVPRQFYGEVIANSKMDAFNKAVAQMHDYCRDKGLIFSHMDEWNSVNTDVNYIGVRTDNFEL